MKGKAFKIFLKIEFISVSFKRLREFEIAKNIRILNIMKEKIE